MQSALQLVNPKTGEDQTMNGNILLCNLLEWYGDDTCRVLEQFDIEVDYLDDSLTLREMCDEYGLDLNVVIEALDGTPEEDEDEDDDDDSWDYEVFPYVYRHTNRPRRRSR